MPQAINLQIKVDGSGNIVIDQTDAKIRKLEQTGKKSASGFDQAWKKVSNTVGGVFTAVALFAAGRAILDIEDRLGAIGRQANLTDEQIESLNHQVFLIGKATHQGPDALLAAIDKIVEKTGDIRLAADSLLAIATAASASGAIPADLAAIVADLNTKFGILPNQMAKALDILYVQGKAGAFTLKDMATQAERVTAAAAAMGLKGLDGLRVMGALLQVIRQATGSSEMAATAFEALSREIVQNSAKIQALSGVMVFDEAGDPRRLDRVIREIVESTGGDLKKLSAMFGGEAMRAVNAFVISFKKFGDFRELDEFMAKGGDMNQLLADAAKRGEEASAKFTNLKTTLLQIGDVLAPVLDGIATFFTILTKIALAASAGFMELIRAWASGMSKIAPFESWRERYKNIAGWAGETRDSIYEKIATLDAKTGEYGATLNQAEQKAKAMAAAQGELAGATDAATEAIRAQQAEVEKLISQAQREVDSIYRTIEAKRQAMLQELSDRAGAYGELFQYDPSKYAQQAADAALAQMGSDEAIRRQYDLLNATEKQDYAMKKATDTARTFFPELEAGSAEALVKVQELADMFTGYIEAWNVQEAVFKAEMEDNVSPKLDELEKKLLELTAKPWTITVEYSGAGAPQVTGAPTPAVTAPAGSHASGIAFVPRDMVTRVHKGETITPSGESGAFRSSGGDTILSMGDVYVGGQNGSPAQSFWEIRQNVMRGVAHGLSIMRDKQKYVGYSKP